MNENLNNFFTETSVEISNPKKVGLMDFVQHAITKIPDNIEQTPAKIMICVYIRYTTINNEELDVWVGTKFYVVNTFNDLNEEFAETMLQGFNNASEQAKLRGSGWSEGKVLEIKLKETKYNPIVGNSYVPLPKALADKKAVLTPSMP